MEYQIRNQEELPLLARELITAAGDRRKWLFYGEIGAGKTTLIQQLCAQLGVVDKVTSPTFSLVNIYRGRGASEGETFELRHLDLYRLDSTQEAWEIGMEDFIYDDGWTFIEWPELVEPLMPAEAVKIKISILDDSSRNILFL